MTETARPDPQAVAWMRDYRLRNPLHRASEAVQGYLDHLATHGPVDALLAYRNLPALVGAWVAAKPPPAPAVEVRDDADGTDSLIEAITTKFDGEDVPLRGEEWRAVADTPYSLVLTQWADSSERDKPTGPKVRVAFTVHVEDAP